MEISVQLVQEDLLSHRKTILADGKGNYSNRVLTYQEKDNPHIKHEISFCDDYVILKRHAEIKTETYLRLNKRGIAKILSPYGELKLDTKLEEYNRDADSIMIRYSIYQGNEVVTNQTLIWKLKGLGI